MSVATAVECPSRPNAAQQNPCLFDHFVGASERHGRHIEAKRAKLWIADLTRLLSCGNRAAHRAAVEHQLVAAHVDNDLSVIGSPLFVELRRNHDAKTRGLALVHGNEKE